MSEKKRTLDLLDRAYRKDAWHGPSLLETIAGVNAATAAKRPLKGAHTIWELVNHVASWNEIVAMRLEGDPPKVTAEWNFPPMPKPPTPAAWKAAQRRLARAEARFRKAVAAFPEKMYGRRRPKTTSTWTVLIHGQIQHQLYHAGQIAMLRRGLGKPIG
jgi:uncharacterized damage-inducible protein DinB